MEIYSFRIYHDTALFTRWLGGVLGANLKSTRKIKVQIKSLCLTLCIFILKSSMSRFYSSVIFFSFFCFFHAGYLRWQNSFFYFQRYILHTSVQLNRFVLFIRVHFSFETFFRKNIDQIWELKVDFNLVLCFFVDIAYKQHFNYKQP